MCLHYTELAHNKVTIMYKLQNNDLQRLQSDCIKRTGVNLSTQDTFQQSTNIEVMACDLVKFPVQLVDLQVKLCIFSFQI